MTILSRTTILLLSALSALACGQEPVFEGGGRPQTLHPDIAQPADGSSLGEGLLEIAKEVRRQSVVTLSEVGIDGFVLALRNDRAFPDLAAEPPETFEEFLLNLAEAEGLEFSRIGNVILLLGEDLDRAPHTRPILPSLEFSGDSLLEATDLIEQKLAEIGAFLEDSHRSSARFKEQIENQDGAPPPSVWLYLFDTKSTEAHALTSELKRLHRLWFPSDQ